MAELSQDNSKDAPRSGDKPRKLFEDFKVSTFMIIIAWMLFAYTGLQMLIALLGDLVTSERAEAAVQGLVVAGVGYGLYRLAKRRQKTGADGNIRELKAWPKWLAVCVFLLLIFMGIGGGGGTILVAKDHFSRDRSISASPAFPGTVVTKKCSKCHKPVAATAKVGDRCPHCRVRWASERTTDSNVLFGKTTDVVIVLLIGAGISVLSFFFAYKLAPWRLMKRGVADTDN